MKLIKNKFVNNTNNAERGKFFLTQDRKVVHDRYVSHIHDLSDELLKDGISRINTDGRKFIEIEVKFDHIIGQTTCVNTDEYDRIIFAHRKNRSGYSRIVLDKKPQDCNTLFIVLKQKQDGNEYIIITAFIGHKPALEVYDQRLKDRQESIDFWNKHALIIQLEDLDFNYKIIHQHKYYQDWYDFKIPR